MWAGKVRLRREKYKRDYHYDLALKVNGVYRWKQVKRYYKGTRIVIILEVSIITFTNVQSRLIGRFG